MEDRSYSANLESPSNLPSDRNARLFVWGVWIVMMLIAFNFMFSYATRIPLAEDWFLVAPLTGKEPDLLKWLWSTVNEHRIPFPRLIYLVLLQITDGDFRVGGFFNIILLGAISLAMVRVVRYLRGDRTIFSDAFFPLALLHLGHSANMLMGWQITQIIPTALAFIVLLLLVGQKTFTTPGIAVLAGSCLILMPLCGANGLLFVPFLAFWLSYCAVLDRQAVKSYYDASQYQSPTWVSSFLIGSSAISLCITALYFVGYQRPYWNPPSPGIGATLLTTGKLLALGLGPSVSRAWMVAIMIASGIFLSGALLTLLRGVLRQKGLERHRALGILLFLGNMFLFCLATGQARAGWVPKLGLPIRYVMFSVPAFCAVYFVWELYGASKLRDAVQKGLLITMLLLLPFNIVAGLYDFGNWYREESVAMERDLVSGMSPAVIAPRWKKLHKDFVERSLDETELTDHLKMLYNAGIKPFDKMGED